jgi:hypothetical protein
MMEQDAAPAGGRQTRLPCTRAARGAPPGGHYEPPAGRRLRGAAVKSLPADGAPESAARRSKFRLRLWAKRNEDDRK